MCDVQLFNGLGILTSGFISISCGLQAYHWQIVVYLAWFSSVTHLSCLTILRQYLSRRPTETYVRYILMVVLVLVLMVAIVPTGFFNWASKEAGPIWTGYGGTFLVGGDDIWEVIFTAADQSSPASCFLDIRLGSRIYDAASKYSSNGSDL